MLASDWDLKRLHGGPHRRLTARAQAARCLCAQCVAHRTQSHVQGDCEGQAPGPDQPTKNQQCVITVPAGFLSLELIAQNVLISKLFIRLDRAPLDTPTARRRLHQTAAAPGPAPDAGDALQPAAAPAPAEVVQAPPPAVVMLDVAQGAAWLHEVVLKGDGQNCRGVEVGSGQRAHAHGAALPAPSARACASPTRAPLSHTAPRVQRPSF